MNKGFRLVTMVALSLVLLVGISLVACEEEEPEALQDLDMSLYQYLKGSTVDMDDATLNTMAEGGGEGGANSMGMGYSPALAGLLPCKEYDNLTAAEKEAVSAWLVTFLGTVDDAIADAGVTLQENPAYVLLHELSGMAWFGKWAQATGATGLWMPQEAFWAGWPDPAGRGSQCEFTDYVALNGLAAYANCTWAGGALKYAEQTAANRALIDADLTAFLTNLANVPTAAYVTSVQVGTDAGTAAGTAAYMAAVLGKTAAAAADDVDDALIGAGFSEGVADAGKAAAEAAYVQGMTPAEAAAAVGTAVGTAAGTVAYMEAVKASDAFTILKTLGKPAADGWAADIDLEVHPRQAFFRWIAKGAVSAMGAAGPLVELSVGEFSFKITNPNEYFVSIDNMSINISVNSDGFGYYPAIDVDAAKLAIGDKMWIPAAKDGVDGEVIVKLSAPIKVYDMITWLVMGGYDGTTGGTYASDVWKQIHVLGTAVFDVTIEATISSETETATQSFTLTWTPAS